MVKNASRDSRPQLPRRLQNCQNHHLGSSSRKASSGSSEMIRRCGPC